MKKIFTSIYLLITIGLYSQKSEIESIETNLFEQYQYLTERAAYQEAKILIKETLEKSKQINHKKGIYWSYIRLGNLECTLDNFKESLSYLDSVQVVGIDTKDKIALATLQIEYGRVYSKSKHSYELALNSFEKGIELSKQIEDKEIRNKNLVFVYQNLYVTYWFLDDIPKGVEYLQKAENIQSDIFNLSYLAYYHLNTTKNNDSLKYYLEKSDKYLRLYPENEFEKPIVRNLWGQYYENINQLDSAIINYQKGLKYSENLKISKEIINSLEGLSRSYGKQNDSEKKAKYLEQLLKIKDSVGIITIEKEKEATKYVLENEIKGTYSVLKRNIYISIAAVILILIIVFFILKERSQRLEKQKIDLAQKKKENLQLKNKVHSLAPELIELAKTNRETFYIRFQEVYGDFYNNLILKYNNLTDTELELIAYICFDFSSKEIAQYTFVEHRTIQTRKYRLRKKLNLDSKDDFKAHFVKLGFNNLI